VRVRHRVVTAVALLVAALAGAEPTEPANEQPVGGVFDGQIDLTHLGEVGLANALRQAHAYYAGSAKPLPETVRSRLAAGFPAEVLDRVRVVETGEEGTLPAIINFVQTRFGDAVGGTSAVTIDDIVAFSQIPEPDEIEYWAHEVEHTVQYRRLGGIDGFAAEYTRNYQGLEDEANAVATQVAAAARKPQSPVAAPPPGGKP
jgi:hypothetical protein